MTRKQPAATLRGGIANKHTAEYRVRFVIDPDAQFEECNGEARPLTEAEYAENEYMNDGKPIPYAEYLRYYGNPDRHVYLWCQVDKRCKCCGAWSHAAGLGNIDTMDDDPDLRDVNLDHWYTPAEAEQLRGYLRDVAIETLDEAGWHVPPSIYCQHKRCKYHHVSAQYTGAVLDTRFCMRHQPAAKS